MHSVRRVPTLKGSVGLYAQPPQVETQGNGVEVRFDVPEKSARLILQRVAKTDGVPPVVADQ